jgi:hypothetical protein
MGLESLGDVFTTLSARAFESVVGTAETEWLEFRGQPYRALSRDGS